MSLLNDIVLTFYTYFFNFFLFIIFSDLDFGLDLDFWTGSGNNKGDSAIYEDDDWYSKYTFFLHFYNRSSSMKSSDGYSVCLT